MKQNVFYLKVKIVTDKSELTENDMQEIVSEVDYNFNHESIVDTEIIDLEKN